MSAERKRALVGVATSAMGLLTAVGASVAADR
jgi:hypothetical protein